MAQCKVPPTWRARSFVYGFRPLDQLLSLQLGAWSAPQDPLPPCAAILKVSFSAIGILFWSTSSSDISPLSCPTRETLPVASYRWHSSQDHRSTQAPPPTLRFCTLKADFKEGRQSISKEGGPGTPVTALVEENINTAVVVRKDRRIILRSLSEILIISLGSTHMLVTEKSNMRRVCA